ncbi:flp pilus assembly protein CpaB [Brevibacillus sp. SYP-B805]|uniref:Flp pilus assembly protein CpaB n=1 Tax=Brevibacillus sp. SYP-B805 TaxID=1578199 RepID=UPI0013EC3D75|nr:flagella basal body P-ring formation protein FlgA [Brevibacillus sp. SYP-B805]NGQ97052.1 flp pilus assembly protein CpaB [Brevibacillus sp. SYP-B805]
MLESKRRAIIFLALSFLLAVTAGFLVLQKIRDVNAQLGEMVDIYVANTDIPSRSLIQPDQVRAKQIPKKFVDQSYITDKMSLQNQVTVVPLSAGDIITKNMIKPATIVRDQNHRLVTVFASGNVRFDQELEALDRVDIIVSHEVNGQPVTEVFMKDVPVAMVARSGDEFKGVALELPFEEVPKFIHQQHYADIIRILKANVGKGELGIPEPFKETEREETGAPADRSANGSGSAGQTVPKAKPDNQPARPPSPAKPPAQSQGAPQQSGTEGKR